MSFVITLAVVASIIVVMARARAAHQHGPPRESISRGVLRLSESHSDEAGLIVDIFWPLTYLYAPKPTVKVVVIWERAFLGEVQRFSRHINARQRAVWIPLEGGGQRQFRCVATGEVESTAHLEIDLGHARHALLTCWPAKRRLVSPARRETRWAIEVLPETQAGPAR